MATQPAIMQRLSSTRLSCTLARAGGVLQALDEGSSTSRSPDQQHKQQQCSEVSAWPQP